MPEYVRVVTFDADDAAIDALVAEVGSAEGAPPGVNASRLTILRDVAGGRVVVAIRFPSQADLDAGGAVLEQMSPPDVGNISRASVDKYEVLLER